MVSIFLFLTARANNFWQATSILAALVFTFCAIRFTTLYRKRRPIAEHGIPVKAVLNQANRLMFNKGFGEAPCLVLFSFDEQLNQDPTYLLNLSEKASSLKGQTPQDADLRAVADIVTKEKAVYGRRRQLPKSFTGNATVYAADLYIESKYLREGRLTEQDRVLLCLAEPGEQGALELVPWWITQEQFAGTSPI